MKEEMPELRSEEDRAIDRLLKELSDDQRDAVKWRIKAIKREQAKYPIPHHELGEHLYKLQEILSVAGKGGCYRSCLSYLGIPEWTANDLIARYLDPESF